MITATRERRPLSSRAFEWVSSAGGAQVMGTGIVSVALDLAGRDALSTVLLAVTALTWAALVVLVPTLARRDPARLRGAVCRPSSLTLVAGTAVLGTELAARGWTAAGGALLIVALAGWVVLIGPVLRRWVTPTTGESLLVSVATESLTVLAATLALAVHAHWLLDASLIPLVLGLALYVFVLIDLDLRQLGAGEGDQWILGGGLAISTLAVAKIAAGARGLGMFGGTSGFETLAIALWVLTMLWLPVLLLAEVIRPRLGYHVRRWATVFPLGMYATSSFAVGWVGPLAASTTFARAWVWVAFAAWIAMAAGTIARAARTWGAVSLSSGEQTRWRLPRTGIDSKRSSTQTHQEG